MKITVNRASRSKFLRFYWLTMLLSLIILPLLGFLFFQNRWSIAGFFYTSKAMENIFFGIYILMTIFIFQSMVGLFVWPSAAIYMYTNTKNISIRLENDELLYMRAYGLNLYRRETSMLIPHVQSWKMTRRYIILHGNFQQAHYGDAVIFTEQKKVSKLKIPRLWGSEDEAKTIAFLDAHKVPLT